MITFKLLLWLGVIAGFVIVNYRIIRNGKRPPYLQHNIAKAALAIVHAVLFNPQNTIDWLPILFFQITSYWILFDLALNIARKLHPLYIGAESGWIDRWGNKHRGPYYFAKMAALVILIISIAVIYGRG